MIKFKKHILALAVGALVLIAATTTGYAILQAQQKQTATQILGPSYLYIQEMEIGQGMVPNEAIVEAKDWVKSMRKTGEFKSVRLYIHNTGPRFALYILTESKDWQSIEKGFDKWFAMYPDMMNKPFRWGAHSDNLISEIPVE